MPWYYCANGAHALPPLFNNQLGIAQNCPHCHQLTVPADNVQRYDRANDYQVHWHEAGGQLMLRVSIGNYRILLTNDVLATDTGAFSPDLTLTPPGGGNWFGQMSNYGGGRRLRGGGVISPSLNTATLRLGQNDPGGSFGLVHIIRGHAQMAHTLSAYPPRAPATFDLTSLRDNLRSVTAAPGVGVGVRWISIQINNGRYVIHGVSAGHQHAMLVIDNQWRIVTGYPGQNMGGLGQAPSPIRDWT